MNSNPLDVSNNGIDVNDSQPLNIPLKDTPLDVSNIGIVVSILHQANILQKYFLLDGTI